VPVEPLQHLDAALAEERLRGVDLLTLVLMLPTASATFSRLLLRRHLLQFREVQTELLDQRDGALVANQARAEFVRHFA
jgi:hypothetical protein